MKNIFLFLTFIFPYTNQLTCLVNCLNFKINRGEQFQDTEPSFENKCRYDRQATKCYGRIMVYYDANRYFEFISYSLGPQRHVIEKEIEDLAIKNRLKSLIYFLFLIESFDIDVLVITASIICQTNDNCALNSIKDLFNLYQKQKNPINQLNFLAGDIGITSQINCYDYQIQQTKECSITHHPACIIHDTNIYQQGCYSDSNPRLEYGFLIKSSKKISLEKIYELIICNTNNCNDNLIRKKIANIIYNNTFGTIISINNANKKDCYLFIYIFLFEFFFMIFKMIFQKCL